MKKNNPYNPETEPCSYKWFEDKTPLKPINDGNTNFELVEIRNRTPHCILHGAMNKVSTYGEGGTWRCLFNQCRAGSEQIKPL